MTKIKLYEVTNGSMGESYVKVFVIADDEKLALDLAEIRYRNSGSTWDNLSAEVLCEDVTNLWVSAVRDY